MVDEKKNEIDIYQEKSLYIKKSKTDKKSFCWFLKSS